MKVISRILLQVVENRSSPFPSTFNEHVYSCLQSHIRPYPIEYLTDGYFDEKTIFLIANKKKIHAWKIIC